MLKALYDCKFENNDNKDWNALTKEVEALQAEWTIGFASKKENQKYDRFRALKIYSTVLKEKHSMFKNTNARESR